MLSISLVALALMFSLSHSNCTTNQECKDQFGSINPAFTSCCIVLNSGPIQTFVCADKSTVNATHCLEDGENFC